MATVDNKVSKSIPRQMPIGLVEEEVVEQATSVIGNIEWIMYVQICIQPILKKGMGQLMVIFYIMQMLKGIALYSIYIPASLEIYLGEVRNLVDFKMLDPDGLIDEIWANQTMWSMITGHIKQEYDVVIDPGMAAAGFENANLVQNLQIYFFYLSCFVVAMMVMYILSMFQCLKDRLKSYMSTTYNAFFFNGFILATELAWLNYCLMANASFTIPIKMVGNDIITEEVDPKWQYIQGVLMYAGLVGYTVFIGWYIDKNSDRLRSPEFQARAGYLVSNIDLTRNRWAKYHAVLFCARRLVFITVPLMLIDVPSIQILFILYQ